MPKSRRTSITITELYAYTQETETGCLEWLPNKDRDGYGRFRINGTKERVNRLVCRLAYGDPFPNALALHSCDNPPCINANHLRWGTAKENTADMRSRNRHGAHYGVLSGSAKLNDEIVTEIRNRNLQRGQYSKTAREFGVTVMTITDIVQGKTWKHLLLSDI